MSTIQSLTNLWWSFYTKYRVRTPLRDITVQTWTRIVQTVKMFTISESFQFGISWSDFCIFHINSVNVFWVPNIPIGVSYYFLALKSDRRVGRLLTLLYISPIYVSGSTFKGLGCYIHVLPTWDRFLVKEIFNEHKRSKVVTIILVYTDSYV